MHYFFKKLKVRILDIEAGKIICILNEKTAKELGLFPLDRIKITKKNGREIHAPIDITDTIVKKEEAGLFRDTAKTMNLKNNSTITVAACDNPKSLYFIKKKIDDHRLSFDEINSIVKDINSNRLSEIEVAAFVTAVYINGFDIDETTFMTKAMIENGQRIDFGKKMVLDKHSVGGLNGRTTMIIVPIIASAGYLIPKTSSRTITSTAGTADAMEVLAPVSLSMRKIKTITKKTGGVIAWGGAINLAPADDKIIRIEHPLNIDPKDQIISSVMAKKAAVGSKVLVLDLPFGPEVKIKTKKQAKEIGKKFKEVGRRLGIKTGTIVTDGSRPVGNNFGPALEAKLALEVLEGKKFETLAKKSLLIAGKLLELAGDCKKGKGYKKAKEILESGQALRKMQEIITAQGGKTLFSHDIKKARIIHTVKAAAGGKVKKINVKNCILVSRSAGAPADKKAGIMLLASHGQKVQKDTPLFEIHANNETKLALALEQQKTAQVMEIG